MNSNEHTFFTKGNVLAKLIVFIIIICIFYFINSKNKELLNREIKNEKIIKYVLLGIIFLISITWVLLVRSNAVADQFFVMDAAMKLKNGDYSMFMPGNYMSYYTVQMGLVTVHYILAYIFGEYNYLAFQILSAIALTLSWNSLYEISKAIGIKSIGRIALLVAGVIFLPYTFYSTFVYGTILGFAFSLAGLKYEILYIKNRKTLYIFLSGLCIALGIMIKSNYLIFLVGMLILLLLWVLKDLSKERIIKAFIACIVIIILYLAQGILVKTFIETKTGIKMDKSMSSLAWLEMGFQDGPRAPGWYNTYNITTYFDAECDPVKQSENVKKDLENTLSEMFLHKTDSLKFLSKKTASQWLNPSFQAIWTVQQTGTELRERNKIINYIISTEGNIRFTEIFEILEFIFFFGLFIYVLAKITEYKESKELGVALLEVIFVGGFIFYLFWEAKGQYTIVYMVLISPLSIIGYSKLSYFIEGIRSFIAKRIIKKNKDVDEEKNDTSSLNEVKEYETIRYAKTAIVTLISLIVVFTLTSVSAKANTLLIHKEDESEFKEYKDFYIGKASDFETGVVVLKPYLDGSSSLYNDGESVLCDDYSDENKMLVINSGKASRLVFPDGKCVTGYLNIGNTYNLEAGSLAENDNQMWKIRLNDDKETYSIYSANGVALTYNNDDYFVYLIEPNGSDYQKWIIETR